MTQTVSSRLSPVLDRLGTDFDAALARWSDFLRIPSVSTDPVHEGDVARAAAWLAADLESIGFSVEVVTAGGHPVVLAKDHAAGEGTPHILYYGHYDVQPPEPLDLWETPPFEPTIVEGPRGKRMVARGAVDDKGQVMTFIEALRAWKAVNGGLPARITLLIEGEEEIGSRNLAAFVEAQKAQLQADVCVISDTPSWDVETPAITTILRGLLYTELTVEGPSHDLHSGFYGGAAVNPGNALARMIAALHDDSGRVRVPGFYDGVAEPSAEELESWRNLNMDESAFLKEIGLETAGGEDGRLVLEKIWTRPTCDVNGLHGGYTGAGAKTVIPSKASAKISFRLVPGQDPAAIAENLRAFFAEVAPKGCRWNLEVHSGNPAVRVPTDSLFLRAALEGLDRVYDRKPVMIGCGGSIPVVGLMRRTLGIDSILMGFGLDDDRLHSPNEKFELACFRNGMRAHAAFLDRLAEMER